MSAVLYEVRDRIAVLTMNRPDALNALNRDMIDGLAEASAQAAADDAVRVLVVRGAGKHFMAGGDLKWFREEIDGRHPAIEPHFQRCLHDVHRTTRTLRKMGKPVIGAVQGAVAGYGLSLMLACDLALAADDAYFTLAYCHIGQTPDGGSTWALPRIVGARKAAELALLGDRFDARTAGDLGLVNRVVPLADLERETFALAERLAQGPQLALARTKALLNQSFSTSLDEQLDAEQASFARCAAEPDFAEGLAAFVEKRRANFG